MLQIAMGFETVGHLVKEQDDLKTFSLYGHVMSDFNENVHYIGLIV